MRSLSMNACRAASARIAAACSFDDRSPTRPVNDLPPRRAFRRRRAAIVEAHDDVAGVGERAMEQHPSPAPAIDHRLDPPARRRREHDDGILACRIERDGFSIQPSSTDAAADVHREELDRRLTTGAKLASQRRRVGERAQRPMRRQFDDVGDAAAIESRPGVERQPAARREIVAVRAGLIRGRHPLGRRRIHRASSDRDSAASRSTATRGSTASRSLSVRRPTTSVDIGVEAA